MYTLVLRRLPTPTEVWKSSYPSSVSIMGSDVAEWELVHHLAAHGTADEIVALVPVVDEQARGTLAELPNQERLRLVPYDRMGELARLRNVVVLSTGPIVTDAAHIRAVCGAPEWVVSGVIHALSSYIAVRTVLLLHLYSMQPYDSLICSSRAGQTAVKNLFDRAGDYLATRMGVPVSCPMQLPLVPLPAPRFGCPLVPRAAARDALGLPSGKVAFLYFGRFSCHMKADLSPLLIAFAGVSARMPEAILVLAGDDRQGQAATLGTLAASLGVSDKVVIRTDPTAAVKALLYSAADVFISVSDSLQETFGLTLLEAMAAGLPVIASNWSGYRDIVRDGETGILVPTFWADCVSSLGRTATLWGDREPNWAAAQTVVIDLAAASAAMERLAGDAGLRRRMGERGRDVATEEFSGETVVRRYEQVWHESLALSASRHAGPGSMDGFTACDYFGSFSHYASHRLSADTVFRVSDSGLQQLPEELRAAVFAQDRAGFETPRLLQVLELVTERRSGSVAQLLGDGADERDVRDLMRLTKYGLLEIVA